MNLGADPGEEVLEPGELAYRQVSLEDALVEALSLALPLELTHADSGVRLGSPYNPDSFAEARCIIR